MSMGEFRADLSGACARARDAPIRLVSRGTRTRAVLVSPEWFDCASSAIEVDRARSRYARSRAEVDFVDVETLAAELGIASSPVARPVHVASAAARKLRTMDSIDAYAAMVGATSIGNDRCLGSRPVDGHADQQVPVLRARAMTVDVIYEARGDGFLILDVERPQHASDDPWSELFR